MRTFYFLRHGQTDWNAAGRYQGSHDIPLNETGLAQAVQAATHYTANPIDRIISSPQLRALVTAQTVAAQLGVPLETDPRLVERHHGSFEGLSKADIAAADPAMLYDTTLTNDWDPAKPLARGSETRASVAARAQAAVLDWLAKYPDQQLLFVAHGAWFRALAHHLTGEIIYSDNATPYVFTAPTDAAGSWLVQAGIASAEDGF